MIPEYWLMDLHFKGAVMLCIGDKSSGYAIVPDVWPTGSLIQFLLCHLFLLDHLCSPFGWAPLYSDNQVRSTPTWRQFCILIAHFVSAITAALSAFPRVVIKATKRIHNIVRFFIDPFPPGSNYPTRQATTTYGV